MFKLFPIRAPARRSFTVSFRRFIEGGTQARIRPGNWRGQKMKIGRREGRRGCNFDCCFFSNNQNITIIILFVLRHRAYMRHSRARGPGNKQGAIVGLNRLARGTEVGKLAAIHYSPIRANRRIRDGRAGPKRNILTFCPAP